jgi:surfeit locus 1 family protein
MPLASLQVSVGRYTFEFGVVPSVMAIALLGLLIWLGMWQLGRETEKRQQQAAFEERGQDAPVLIDAREMDSEGLRFRAATALGRYDATHQFLLDNRTHLGVAGYHVYTPLLLERKAAVLVNRGWVPLGQSREVLPKLPVPSDQVQVRGTVAVPAGDAILLGPSGYDGDRWPRVVQHVDLVAAEKLLGIRLVPYLMQLDADEAFGFVREWRPFYGIPPEKHRAYAVQWFSLAAVLVVVCLVASARPRAAPVAREPGS